MSAHMRHIVCATILAVALVAGVSASAQGEYVWATSSASVACDLGFNGLWKYCVHITWDVSGYDKPHGISNISSLLGLQYCTCACLPGYFAFADTAGSGPGEGGCTVHYYVDFVCKGDPTIPDKTPAIKFEPYPGACEPGVVGYADVCFYSPAPPKPVGITPASVWIKFGLELKEGPVYGVIPDCSLTPSAVEHSTWGAIKALFE